MISEDKIKPKTRLPVSTKNEEKKFHRTFRPKIELKNCKKLYDCFTVCPENAITINEDGYPVINYNKCSGCLLCVRECRCRAIIEERE